MLALNRNWVFAISALAQCKLANRIDRRGDTVGGEGHSHQSARSLYCRILPMIGIVHLLQSRTDEAIPWLENARTAAPAHAIPHAGLAAAYALKNETERAATELAEARRLSSDNRYSNIAQLRTKLHVPKIRALYENTYYAGLQKAGMPEE